MDQTAHEPNSPTDAGKDLVSHAARASSVGDDMAYGIQQTLACYATDAVGMVLSNEIQLKQDRSLKRFVNLLRNFAGEAAGDILALFSFVAIRQVLPQPIAWLKKGAAFVAGGLYAKATRVALNDWAMRHGVEKDSPAYQQKRVEMIGYEAEDFAKSSVIAAGSLFFNVALMRVLPSNTLTTWQLTKSKLAGTFVTMAVMLIPRLAVPTAMHRLDVRMSKKITPVVESMQRMVGVAPKAHAPQEEESSAPLPQTPERKGSSYSQRIASQRETAETASALSQ